MQGTPSVEKRLFGTQQGCAMTELIQHEILCLCIPNRGKLWTPYYEQK